MRVIKEVQEKEIMNDFSMEDVKELVFSTTMAAYNEKKQLIAYIKQLEEKLKTLEEAQESQIDDGK